MPDDDEQDRWSESGSQTFIAMGDIYVPRREEQISTLLDLIPADRDDACTFVELGAGEGVLARAVLAAFPRCHYVALDGSDLMRRRLSQTLGEYGDRIAVRPFDLFARDWRRELPSPLRCVLSSLVVHHLDGEGKRVLFRDLAHAIEPGGALLLADLVAPTAPGAAALFARQWDDAARAQSLAVRGDLSGYDQFVADTWNFFTIEGADPMDQPSPLADQLVWLREAGFATVDCFWMYAGHAIYGGYR
jgi:tRNA (cmo5U34)-methyltransferase